MSSWMLIVGLAVPIACYTTVSVAYIYQNNPGLALAWIAYALANCGFIWAALQGAAH